MSHLADVAPPRPGPPIGREDEVGRAVAAVVAGPGVVVTGGHGSGRTTILAAVVDRLREVEPGRPLVAVGAASITAAEVRAAVAGPPPRPVLVIDDLELLGAGPVSVVQQVVSAGQASLLGAARVEPGADDPAGAWWRDVVGRVALAALDRPAADALAEELMAGPIAATSRERLWAFARGHPGWVVAAVRATLGAGVWERRAGLWSLTEALDALVVDAVRALDLSAPVLTEVGVVPAEVRVVLEALALAERLPIEAAEALGGPGALAAAERRGLVRVEGDDPDDLWCAPANEMLGGAIRAAIGDAERSARWTLVVQALSAVDRRAPAADLIEAWARLEAAGAAGVDPSDLDALVRGAEAAIAGSRWERGARIAEAAWRATGDHRALDLLTQCLSVLGDHGAVRRLAEEVLGGAPGAEAVAGVAELLAVTQFHTGDPEGALETLERGRAAASATARARLDAMESRLRTFLGHHQRVEELLAPLVGHPDPEIRIEARTGHATLAVNAGRTAEAVAGYEAALTDALGSPDAPVALAGTPFLFRLAALAESGRLAEADREARAVERDLAALDDPTAHGWLSLHLARVALRTGRPAEAVRWAGEAVGDLDRVNRPGWSGHPLALLVAAHVMAGDRAAARSTAEEWGARPPHAVAIFRSEELRLLAALDAAEGRRDEAEARLGEAVAQARAAGMAPYLAAALHDLARLGGAPAAADAARQLTEVRARSDSPLVAAWDGHARGRVGADIELLAASATALSSMGARVHAAEAWAEVARVTDDDRIRAAARRREAAVREAGEGFWSPLLEVGDPRPRLTEREAEIAALVAEGRSRQDIAEGLVVSVRTIDSHLQRIYRKLGVRGREGLVAALGAHPAGGDSSRP